MCVYALKWYHNFGVPGWGLLVCTTVCLCMSCEQCNWGVWGKSVSVGVYLCVLSLIPDQ